jgi:hypothetical protein
MEVPGKHGKPATEFTPLQKMEMNAIKQVAVWILEHGQQGAEIQREIAEYQRLVEARYGSKARDFQLYQVLIGGTPNAGDPYDFPDEKYSVRRFYDTIRQRVGGTTQDRVA